MDLNRLDRELRRQTEVNSEIAVLLARQLGIETRKVIARSIIIGLPYQQKSKMTSRQAELAFVPEPETTQSSNKIAEIAGILLVLLAIIGLGTCMFKGDKKKTAPQTSEVYAKCEAELKPKLSQCMASGRQDTWEACGQAYMAELKECTGH